jgi:hypothetical protein
MEEKLRLVRRVMITKGGVHAPISRRFRSGDSVMATISS